MKDQEFDERYFERLERARSHWWTRGMQAVALSLLGNRDIGDVLDDGCGSGASVPLLHRLRARRIHAIDIAWPAVRAYRDIEPSARCAMASATRLPYAGESFDLVVSADVLQHLTAAHASKALGEIARILRPGGRALIRTNAAFGRSKVADREGWRLYRPDVLAGEIGSSGLALERLTHANAAQGLWASLPRPRRRTKHDHDRAEEATGHGLGIPDAAGPLTDAVGAGLMKLEARWLRRSGRTLPFGHTLVAVAVKPPRRSASAS